MKVRYLVDENLSARVVATIQRHYPALDVLCAANHVAASHVFSVYQQCRPANILRR
jgi:hypothetical protein